MGFAVAKTDWEDEDIATRVAQLSDGQLEVLHMVADHLSSKEIAVELDISPTGSCRTSGNGFKTAPRYSAEICAPLICIKIL